MSTTELKNILDLAQTELKSVYKRLGIQDSNILQIVSRTHKQLEEQEKKERKKKPPLKASDLFF